MSNNCLVTKLKGVVDNDNLPYLGYLTHVLKGSDNIGGLHLAISSGNIKFIGGTFNNGGTQVREFTPAPGTLYRFAHNQHFNTVTPDVEGGDVTIIFPKYSITQYENWGVAQLYPGDLIYSPDLTLLQTGPFSEEWDISNLSVWPNLHFLNLENNSGLVGDVGILPTLTQLTTINFSDVKGLTGNLDACGSLALTRFQAPNTKNVSLSIENFVRYNRDAGRTTGSLSLPWVGAVSCTFNGASVPNQNTNDLSWTASTITFNGTTIDA